MADPQATPKTTHKTLLVRGPRVKKKNTSAGRTNKKYDFSGEREAHSTRQARLRPQRSRPTSPNSIQIFQKAPWALLNHDVDEKR